MFSIRTVKMPTTYAEDPKVVKWDNWNGNLADLLPMVKVGKKLGSGFYGSAYDHPTKEDRVIKISSTRDQAYPVYIEELSKVMGNNDHVPTVYAATKYEWKCGKSMMVVELERLTDSKEDNTWKRNSATFQQFQEYVEGGIGEATVPAAWKFVRRLIVSVVERNKKPGERFSEIRTDLHFGNIMVRGDVPVVTDPFVGKPIAACA